MVQATYAQLEEVAKKAHAAVHEFAQSAGDKTLPAWGALSLTLKQGAIDKAKFYLMNPGEPAAEDAHGLMLTKYEAVFKGVVDASRDDFAIKKNPEPDSP
jgi:hypothetical protein